MRHRHQHGTVDADGRSERGQVLVLAALAFTVVLGMAAVVIDIGQLAVGRRQLQNAADAGALAGVQELPQHPTDAEHAARQWAQQNGSVASEVTATAFTTTVTTDTLRVQLERVVPYTFARVLGLTSTTLRATATARLRVLNGITTGQPRAFPYAVWDGNAKKLKLGNRVTFRSNTYADTNVDPAANCQKTKTTSCTWDVSGNNFKGYFHWQNGYKLYVKPTEQAFSQGGNAFGTDDAAALWAAYQAGTPVLLPVINHAVNPSGSELDFVITAFVCVQITQMDQSGSVDWQGQLVACTSTGHDDGPAPPTIPGAYLAKLVE